MKIRKPVTKRLMNTHAKQMFTFFDNESEGWLAHASVYP